MVKKLALSIGVVVEVVLVVGFFVVDIFLLFLAIIPKFTELVTGSQASSDRGSDLIELVSQGELRLSCNRIKRSFPSCQDSRST